MPISIGVDIGGTFTDAVAIDERGRITYSKVPTTPKDRSIGFMNALEGIRFEPAQVSRIVHGTTTATNAIIERRVAKSALIATKDLLEDVLEQARWHRRYLYDLHQEKPKPFIPRYLRKGLTERTLADGKVLNSPDLKELRDLLDFFVKEKVESIAVCFLNSYANPENEKKIKEEILRVRPELFVSLSSEVSPTIREYARTSTTVINACTQPLISRYVDSLLQKLQNAGLTKEHFQIMQSNGGMMTVDEARQMSVKTLMSGPAGGVIGAAFIASLTGYKNLISMDMGGTSFDVCLIENGVPQITTESEVEWNVPVTVPMVDVKSIGAGGGSIAWIDAGNIMKVGPQSAAADPGPACYGLGGDEPTVTDAHVVLGRLNPEYLLGGKMKIHRNLAEKAIREKICHKLGLGLEKVSQGIIDIVNANMSEAIKIVSVERGYDPRDFVIFAYGGAGPLHACELAEELEIRKIIIPFAPGMQSAIGFLATDLKYDYVRAYMRKVEQVDATGINSIFRELEDAGAQALLRSGVSKDKMRFHRSGDLRYLGQTFTVNAVAPQGRFDKEQLEALVDTFHRNHEDLYKFKVKGEPVFIENLRVTAIGQMAKPRVKRKARTRGKPRKSGTRPIFIKHENAYVDCPVYKKEQLTPGMTVRGPCVIEQFDATTFLPPSYHAEVDGYLNLLVTRR